MVEVREPCSPLRTLSRQSNRAHLPLPRLLQQCLLLRARGIPGSVLFGIGISTGFYTKLEPLPHESVVAAPAVCLHVWEERRVVVRAFEGVNEVFCSSRWIPSYL